MRLRALLTSALSLLPLTQGMATEMVTGRELVRRQQAAPMEAIVQHCHNSAPETSERISAGYTNFATSLQTAMNMWIAEKPEKQKVLMEKQISSDSHEAKEALAALKEIGVKVADSVKQYDPQKYCPWLAQRLSAATPESILKTLHQYDARVESMKNNKRP
jgi:hypothetical protein